MCLETPPHTPNSDRVKGSVREKDKGGYDKPKLEFGII